MVAQCSWRGLGWDSSSQCISARGSSNTRFACSVRGRGQTTYFFLRSFTIGPDGRGTSRVRFTSASPNIMRHVTTRRAEGHYPQLHHLSRTFFSGPSYSIFGHGPRHYCRFFTAVGLVLFLAAKVPAKWVSHCLSSSMDTPSRTLNGRVMLSCEHSVAPPE